MSENLREIRTYLDKFNFEFDPAYLIDRMILQLGYWEQRVIGYLNNFIKPNMLVVDVGANAGYHTLLMADLVGPQGQVLAFEPNPDTRSRLIRNLEINPELQSRVKVYDLGLGSKEENLFVKNDPNIINFGNASLVQESSGNSDLAIKVVRLDDFVKESISLLKVDVEGMELQVLEGAKRHLQTEHPIIIFETLRSSPPEAHKPIEDFLKQFGYRIFVSSPDGSSLNEIQYPNYPYEDSVAIFLELS